MSESQTQRTWSCQPSARRQSGRRPGGSAEELRKKVKEANEQSETNVQFRGGVTVGVTVGVGVGVTGAG